MGDKVDCLATLNAVLATMRVLQEGVVRMHVLGCRGKGALLLGNRAACSMAGETTRACI